MGCEDGMRGGMGRRNEQMERTFVYSYDPRTVTTNEAKTRKKREMWKRENSKGELLWSTDSMTRYETALHDAAKISDPVRRRKIKEKRNRELRRNPPLLTNPPLLRNPPLHANLNRSEDINDNKQYGKNLKVVQQQSSPSLSPNQYTSSAQSDKKIMFLQASPLSMYQEYLASLIKHPLYCHQQPYRAIFETGQSKACIKGSVLTARLATFEEIRKAVFQQAGLCKYKRNGCRYHVRVDNTPCFDCLMQGLR
ncbi:hypothetical protein EAF04_004320 [Stromatinia cepivora]|nr:hypothetical protein EAF04_004320 [Stromatinia cepivora]